MIWDVFTEFVGVSYSTLGNDTFAQFLHNDEALAKLVFIGAVIDEKIIGIIALDRNRNHISLFFVTKSFQHQGIGRKLFAFMLSQEQLSRVTVNAALNACRIYQQLGFTATDAEQLKDGIRYQPMVYTGLENPY
ncbi:hypothetical protein SDC9_107604 [bioreactor metagenome]|uniref:N-acetyltransferase domain-containing protein n=1 Tax=bioreactor metagenome TaxID=1076179 RepID=A0A645B818_9ZZZZ